MSETTDHTPLEVLLNDPIMKHFSLAFIKTCRAEHAQLRAELSGQIDALKHWNALWSHICAVMGCVDYLPNDQNFNSMLEHAIAQLRADLQAAQARIANQVDDFSVASICEALGIDDNDNRTPSQIVNDAARLLTQQAARITEQERQLEQARWNIGYLSSTLTAVYLDHGIDPKESDSLECAGDWLTANAPQEHSK